MSLNFEREIIATILHNGLTLNCADALDMLEEQMFCDTQMRACYSVICAMRSQHQVIDLNTIADHLQNQEAVYLLSALKTDCVGNNETVIPLARAVHREWANKHVKNELSAICSAIEQAGGSIALEDISKRVTGVLAACELPKPRTPAKIGSMLLDYCEILEARLDQKESARGLDVGLEMMLNRTDLMIIGGTPGAGKTALAMYVADYVAQQGKKVLFYSLEMEAIQLVEREIGRHSKISTQALRDPLNHAVDMENITSAVAKLNDAQIYIDDTPSLNINSLETSARKFAQQHSDCALIVVDYLTLMAAPKAERRDLAIGEITRRAKLLAKELEIPICLLSQLNRNAPNQKREPMISDLRDSGSIEQDADKIVFPYRNDDNDGLVKVLKRKVRDGKPGEICLEDINGNLYATNQQWAEPEPEAEQPKRKSFKDMYGSKSY